ncbi:hypothetical protein HMPREF3038_02017 [Akkermansia sp. KLE1797]|nr:hypothetical protein HMPREF3038_02017 [Akkermansia sp. KLE1797]KXU54740.1 hypothetical protein HMPREF3039_01213 [Akkermansia sp. KLE1798]KZA06083.1 hypothetical protein HMPREF1326_00347 [Akkermansia sp. KLE1605]
MIGIECLRFRHAVFQGCGHQPGNSFLLKENVRENGFFLSNAPVWKAVERRSVGKR